MGDVSPQAGRAQSDCVCEAAVPPSSDDYELLPWLPAAPRPAAPPLRDPAEPHHSLGWNQTIHIYVYVYVSISRLHVCVHETL